jgi:hypothetical protein
VRHADGFINARDPDMHLFLRAELFECSGWADLSTLQAECASLESRYEVWSVTSRIAIRSHLNTAGRADILTEIAMNTAREKFLLG